MDNKQKYSLLNVTMVNEKNIAPSISQILPPFSLFQAPHIRLPLSLLAPTSTSPTHLSMLFILDQACMHWQE